MKHWKEPTKLSQIINESSNSIKLLNIIWMSGESAALKILVDGPAAARLTRECSAKASESEICQRSWGEEGIKEAALLMEGTGKSVICQIGAEDEGSTGSEIHNFHFLQRGLLLCLTPAQLIMAALSNS